MSFLCPLEGEMIQKKCRVTSCMYYSNINETNCFGVSMPEFSDVSLQELAAHKGVSVKQARRLIVEHEKAILYAVDRVAFVEWFRYYPRRHYLDWHFNGNQHKAAIIRSWVKHFGALCKPSKLERWTYPAVLAASMSYYWGEFCKETGRPPGQNWPEALGVDVAATAKLHKRIMAS